MADQLLSNVTFQDLVEDSVLAALYCSLDNSTQCLGICSNPDISGVGVRVAFYLQSILNAVLVTCCPEDSAAGQWSAVILTMALIIPAIINKYQGQMTLFHGTLVLNFATLSTLASVAIAPRCTVWRPDVSVQDLNPTHWKQKEARRGRVVLSFAVIAQIILQWLWAIIMFTAPDYDQAECNGETWLYFFGYPLMAQDIDPGLRPNASMINGTADVLDNGPSHLAIWPLWLLFCLGLTMAYALVLAVTSPSDIYETPYSSHFGSLRSSRRVTRGSTPLVSQRASRVRSLTRARSPWRGIADTDTNDPNLDSGTSTSGHYIPHWLMRLRTIDSAHIWLVFNYGFAVVIFILFIVITELQHQYNDLLPGENLPWSFGQSAAILLAIAPLWALFKKLYTTPEEGHESLEISRRSRLDRHEMSSGSGDLTLHVPTSIVELTTPATIKRRTVRFPPRKHGRSASDSTLPDMLPEVPAMEPLANELDPGWLSAGSYSQGWKKYDPETDEDEELWEDEGAQQRV